MTETPFDKEIYVLETRIGVVETQLAILRQKRAEYLCPFKVGQQLVSSSGKQVMVVEIQWPRSPWRDYILIGRDILKSGNLGKVPRRLYSWHGWKASK